MADDTKLGSLPNTSPAVIPNTDASLELRAVSPLLAAELAAGLSSPKTVRTRFGLSSAQWDILRTNPTFRSMLKDALLKWRGDLNAGARITLKAEVLLEELLPKLYDMVNSDAVPSSEKINAIKQLADLAGRNSKKEGTPAGNSNGFVLNINVGGDKKTVTIDATPEPKDGG